MSLVRAMANSACPGEPKWRTEDMPDLSGRVMLVTGGNAGIGKETVKALLAKNAKVYLAARSRAKAQTAIDELKAATGREAVFLELDLSDLRSVRVAAATFLSLERKLHVLFANAGVMTVPMDQLTADGYDLQWGTNVVGHWLLQELLIPALARAAASAPDGRARVVHTSSDAAYIGKIDYTTVRPGASRTKKGTMGLYSQSKLGNVLVARESARRHADKGILVNAVHPGWIGTELQRHAPSVQQWISSKVLHPAPLGALTQLYVATGTEAANATGKWFIPWAKEGKLLNQISQEEEDRLRAWLEAETATKGM